MKTMLVLGGGGVKGLAHVGAWRAIHEAGVAVSGLVGTSIGALVGARIAAGDGWEVLSSRAMALDKSDIVSLNRWALLFNGIRQTAVFRGDTFRAYLESVLPPAWDALRMDLSVNAVDLETGEMKWFGAGGSRDAALADAVYASCALPMFYPPASIGGELYVDGGVRDPLPIEFAASRGADRIIAVDVGAGPVKDSEDTVSKGLVAIQHRVFEIMSYERKRLILDSWSGPPLVYVRPQLDRYSTFDFGQTAHFLEEGYRATLAGLVEAGLWLPDRAAEDVG